MLKRNELRIGNFVFLEGQIFRIERGDQLENNFKPIPLTSKILGKFGFNKVGDVWADKRSDVGDQNDNYSCGIIIQPGTNFRFLIFAYKHKGTAIELEFLHTLQNIYFCLYEKELEINSIHSSVLLIE